MKKKRIVFLIVILAGLLIGWKKTPPEPPRVVTQLNIRCDRGYCVARRTYTDSRKIVPILNHLRQRKNLVPALTDPERLAGDSYRIELCMSDGTKYVYYQRSGQYYSAQCHAWQKIDPEQAQLLVELLRRMPSD